MAVVAVIATATLADAAPKKKKRLYKAKQTIEQCTEWPCFDASSRNTAIHTALNAFEKGIASFYWQPQRVASGGWFNPNAMTAAHKSLPFGTKVKVTNHRNGNSVVVTINDRGPYIKGRIIDLSKAAAQKIGMVNAGIVPVSLEKM